MPDSNPSALGWPAMPPARNMPSFGANILRTPINRNAAQQKKIRRLSSDVEVMLLPKSTELNKIRIRYNEGTKLWEKSIDKNRERATIVAKPKRANPGPVK